jgi:hypothetical protein
MKSTETNILDDRKTLLKTWGERGIKRDFIKSGRCQLTPSGTLSDYVLLESYRHLISELENEELPELREKLVKEIVTFEAELTNRNLLDKANAI